MPSRNPVGSEEASSGTGATLEAWRERGAQRLDPVRFHFIETLARRAAAHGGDARRILDDKVAGLLAAYGEDLEKAARAEGTPAEQPARGALAELADHLARHASSQGDGAAAHRLKTLEYFRNTWSRLSAERRLTQSLAKLPQNAGPLNSHNLVHRSLTLMRDLSPEYLNRFMSYVDDLLWVDQASSASASAGADAPRAEGARKSARGKAG